MKLGVFLLAAMLCLAAAVSQADERSDLKAQSDALTKELSQAKATFRKALPTLPEYQNAKRKLDESSTELFAARATRDKSDRRRLDAAVNAMAATEKELRTVTEQLEAKDRGVAAVNEKLTILKTKIDAFIQNEKAEQERQRQAEAAELEKRRSLYRKVIEVDYSKKPARRTSVPFIGDETSILEVKVDPAKFASQSFILCGDVHLSNFQDVGYTGRESDFYCVVLRQLDRQAHATDHEAILCLKKSLGESIVGVLSKRDQMWRDDKWCMRVRAKVNPKIVANFRVAEKVYEMYDWQFLGKDGWSPWYSETQAK